MESAAFPAHLFEVGGSPEAIESSATRYRSFGRSASEAADQMTAMDTTQFIGPEGDQFREKLTSNMPPHLRITGEAFTKVADALRKFASVLTDVQRHMRPVEGQAPGAWQRLQAAKAGLAEAQAADQRHEAAQQQAQQQHQQAVTQAKANNQPPPPAPTSNYQAQVPSAQAELNTAQREWDALVRKADGLRGEMTAASESCTKAINTAKDMRFAEPPGTWDLFGHAENFITEHKDVLKKISGALKIASAALTVVGLALQAIPVVGNAVGGVLLLAGGVMGGAALAIDIGIYAATGEGSLTSIVIDTALTVIPIGRLAKLGKKAFSVVKSADEVAAVSDDAAKFADDATTSSDEAVESVDEYARTDGGPVDTDDLVHPNANLLDDELIQASKLRDDDEIAEEALTSGKTRESSEVQSLIDEYDPHGGMTKESWEERYWPSGEYDHLGRRKLDWDQDTTNTPDGFASPESRNPTVLQPDEVIDRFGVGFGRYTSPDGVPYAERSLPPDNLDAGYHRYRVTKELPVWEGPIAKNMGQPGGGIQHYMPEKIVHLIHAGYLEEIT